MTIEPSATAPHERVEALDVLRGLALLGVLLSNLNGWFRVGYAGPINETMVDLVAEGILSVLIEHKAFVLFSFLFGIGLAIQAERLGQGRRNVLVRRFLALLAFGLIHLFLIWNGDILAEYAVAGLLVLPLLFTSTRIIAAAAIIALATYLAFEAAAGSFLELGFEPARAHAAHVFGGYVDRIAFGVQEELGFVVRLHLFVLPRTIGLMLLGVLAWRARLLHLAVQTPWRMRAAGVILLLIGWLPELLGGDSVYLAPLGPVILGAGYAALLFGFADWAQRRLALAAGVGRMALTNYLMQSVVLGFVFFGHGLALQSRIGALGGIAIGLGLWLAQAAFSAWWLKSHRFGPMEWLWRAVSYGRRP